MTEFSALFSSDSPFKFLFLSGILLLIIGMYYPYEKRTALDLKKNEVERQEKSLLVELEHLGNDLDEMIAKSDNVEKRLDSLVRIRRAQSTNVEMFTKAINEEKIAYNLLFDKITEQKHTLELKTVAIQYSGNEIAIYEGHLRDIRAYSFWFLFFGLIFTLAGGGWWIVEYYRKPKHIVS